MRNMPSSGWRERAPMLKLSLKEVAVPMLTEEKKSQQPGVGPELGISVGQKEAGVAGTRYAKGKGREKRPEARSNRA